MLSEHLPPDALLFAQDRNGNYAMAFLLCNTIITAHHVAEGNPVFQTPRTAEQVQIALRPVPGQDLALSQEHSLVPGFEKWTHPQIGQRLTIVGYHGKLHRSFEIGVEVLALEGARLRVQRIDGDEAEVGMSGSPAVTEQLEVVGILVAGVEGTNGQQLYLEPIASIFSQTR